MWVIVLSMDIITTIMAVERIVIRWSALFLRVKSSRHESLKSASHVSLKEASRFVTCLTRNNGDIDTVDGFGRLLYFFFFLCPIPPQWNWRSHGTFKAGRYKLTCRFPSSWSSPSPCRRRHRHRRRRRGHRGRLRRFMSSTNYRAVERGCPISGPFTWILCGNQDLLLKYGTARERRKERQECTNGESNRATRGDKPRGRWRRRRLVAPCPSSVSRSSGCSRCTSSRLFRSRPLEAATRGDQPARGW